MDDQLLAGALTSIGPLGTIAVIVIRLLLDIRRKIESTATAVDKLEAKVLAMHGEHISLASRVDEVWESTASIKIDIARLEERVASRTGPMRMVSSDEVTGRVVG